MSFKFIAVAYGMLGATAATGYYVQGGGGGGMGAGGAGRAANPPKAERVAKLEVPPMPERPVPAPVPAPVAAPGPDTMPRAEVPGTATASVMPLTAPPTPPPPPASVATASASDGGFSRGYMQITADMTVNPWTGAWLTSDDRAMGYITGPVTAQPAPAPVMVAEAPEPAPPPPPPKAAPSPAVAAAPEAVPSAVPLARAAVIDRTAEPAAEPKPETPQRGGYMAHLASYRDQEHAMAGWKTLKKSHRDLLINRAPVMVRAEIPGQGTFVRLMTDGFTQLTDVSEFCTGLKASGQYCNPMKGK
ncbi:hypothetical protein JL101_024310 [Skermanella rosea]|uniref:hypothetical protein n=1 Tax=Skermanella rosea TaxID=1817965 RepID=UPI001931C722|nr:hypothetical protein [Skermanella rosea]UEM03061.1 hypothetical protein JL101_024310 [Skermanella rosea]